MIALLWLKDNWRLALVLALVSALGVQSYRLLGAQRERDVLSQAQEARKKQDALAALANKRNKERTDEEYTAARLRAARARVVPNSATISAGVAPATSGAGGALCFDRGQLDEWLAGFTQRHAERLTAALTDVARRHAAGAGVIAEHGEELAAAYRACQSWALNLVAPGEESAGEAVGGGSHDGSSPVSR